MASAWAQALNLEVVGSNHVLVNFALFNPESCKKCNYYVFLVGRFLVSKSSSFSNL